jgi:hypothetical protein
VRYSCIGRDERQTGGVLGSLTSADEEKLGCAGFVRLRKCEVCEPFERVARPCTYIIYMINPYKMTYIYVGHEEELSAPDPR